MADFGASGFDANKVEPNEGFGLLPAGDYEAIMVKSAEAPTKDGTGAFLKTEFQILNGKYQNRKLFHNFNLWLLREAVKKNPGMVIPENTKTAIRISEGNLSALCRAIGVLTPKASEELHNKPVRITVKAIPAKGEYAAKNEISSFKARQSGPGGPPPAAPVYQQAPAAFPSSAPVAPVNAAPAAVAAPW